MGMITLPALNSVRLFLLRWLSLLLCHHTTTTSCNQNRPKKVRKIITDQSLKKEQGGEGWISTQES